MKIESTSHHTPATRPAYGRRSSPCFSLPVLTFILALHLSWRDLDSAGYSAATDMLVQDAKRLALLHGNYSRVGFYHPGPHLFYLMAAGEFLFRDLLGIAKSTEAAQ